MPPRSKGASRDRVEEVKDRLADRGWMVVWRGLTSRTDIVLA